MWKRIVIGIRESANLILLGIMLTSLGLGQERSFNVAGYDCGDCHGAAGWEILTLSGFNHDFTQFPLTGSHKVQDCSACHEGNTIQEKHDFEQVTATCSSCHIDVHQLNLGQDCQRCHETNSWQVTTLSFDHEQTQFSLLGAHRNVACEQCHTDKPMIDFTSVTPDCWGCHEDNYMAVAEPSHALAQFDHDCSVCHQPRRRSWTPSDFDHNEFFELTGAHKLAQNDCFKCHEGVFTGTPRDCRPCHEAQFVATGTEAYPNAPRHTESDYFAEQCETCHSTVDWLPVDFNHAETGYELTGLHLVATCDQCHGTAGYDLPQDCHGCHQPHGIATTSILDGTYDHVTHLLPADCTLCHSTIGWDQNHFEHSTFTGETCEDCHLIDHAESTNPPHGNDNIRTDCIACHEPGNGWEIPDFPHDATQTDYALIGMHLLADCELCHPNQVYNTTPTDCQNSICHATQYTQTSSPDHQLYGYPDVYCEQCHLPMGWIPSIFTHPADITTIETCSACHTQEYQATTNPVHDASQGFTTDCAMCHISTETWLGAEMDHSKVTAPCADCHIDNYNQAQNPNHVEKQYPTVCDQCHLSTTTWYDAFVDHSNFTGSCYDASCHYNDYHSTTDPNHVDNQFPTTCDDCHLTTNTWRMEAYTHPDLGLDCIICHQTQYEVSTYPNHTDNNFSPNCLVCHESTNTWLITTYPHTEQVPCAVCHIEEYNNTTDPNHAANNYDLNCILCHVDPNATWGDAVFDHSTITAPCWDCHSGDYLGVTNPDHAGNNYDHDCTLCHNGTVDWNDVTFDHTNITSGCVDCHLGDYQDVLNPDHAAQGYPQDCELCHNTVDWNNDFFSHAFPIFSGEHAGEWSTCIAECHINPQNFQEFSCGLNGVCHEHNASKMNSEHQGESGYVYESWACYDCHPNGDEDDGDGDGDDGDRRRPPKHWFEIIKKRRF
ncbi:MAG: hypothetical protein ACE5D8_05365 [Fidelibacterota bacterium]